MWKIVSAAWEQEPYLSPVLRFMSLHNFFTSAWILIFKPLSVLWQSIGGAQMKQQAVQNETADKVSGGDERMRWG